MGYPFLRILSECAVGNPESGSSVHLGSMFVKSPSHEQRNGATLREPSGAGRWPRALRRLLRAEVDFPRATIFLIARSRFPACVAANRLGLDERCADAKKEIPVCVQGKP